MELVSPILKKIQIKDKYTSSGLRVGTTGFIYGMYALSPHSNIIIYELIVTRSGKGGKPKIKPDHFSIETVDTTKFTEKQLAIYKDKGIKEELYHPQLNTMGTISILDISKDIHNMNNHDFLCYIATFSRFLMQLRSGTGALRYGRSPLPHPRPPSERNLENYMLTNLSPYKLFSYILHGYKLDEKRKNSIHMDKFYAYIELKEHRSVIMHKLFMEAILVKDYIKSTIKNIETRERAVTSSVKNLLTL